MAETLWSRGIASRTDMTTLKANSRAGRGLGLGGAIFRRGSSNLMGSGQTQQFSDGTDTAEDCQFVGEKRSREKLLVNY